MSSPVLYFDPIPSGPNVQTVAAALIQNPTGGAAFQQLSFFLPFATWSDTSKSLNKVWYSWGMGTSLASVASTSTSTISSTTTSTSSSAVATPTVPLTLNDRVLIISMAGDEAPVVNTLTQYNTPYDVIYTTSAGFTSALPALSSGTTGFYKLVVMTYVPFWNPPLLQPIMNYLSTFNGRLVRIYDIPDSSLGVDFATGLGYDNGQTISFAQTSFATDAGLSSGLVLSSSGLYHIPAKITDASLASAVLYFDPIAAGPTDQTVAAALIQNPRGGVAFQQLSFFLPFATWSDTSKSLNQVWYSWGMKVPLAPTV
ncbi:hypothetical protein HDU76_010339 [Blyttiomyces sp. JEL0837]|nr:hypothetical protein HDU76_010339 [Blyttiomyces sp. JEL0837]